MREATALIERVELLSPGVSPEPIVIGFRRNGSVSVFIGADLVFQFNSQSELRRGYQNGSLLTAEKRSLVRLTRNRTEQEVQLVRHALALRESDEFVDLIRTKLAGLAVALADGSIEVIGQVPPDQDILGRIEAWLIGLPSQLEIAMAPNNC